jgi:hypothetical protein
MYKFLAEGQITKIKEKTRKCRKKRASTNLKCLPEQRAWKLFAAY